MSEAIKETVDNVTTTVDDKGVTVEVREGTLVSQADDVVNCVTDWAKENPRTAVAVGAVAAVATTVVAVQLVKKAFS